MLGNRKRSVVLDGTNQSSKQSKKVFIEDGDDLQVDQEEKDLEAFIFGGASNLVNEDAQEGQGCTFFLDKGNQEEENLESNGNNDEEEEGDLLAFEISTKPSVDFQIGEKSKEKSVPIQLGGKKKSKAAWVDPDDEDVHIDIQKRHYRKFRVEEEEKEISGKAYQERLKTNFEKVVPAPAWANLERAEAQSDSEDSDDDDEDKIFKTRKKLVDKPDHLIKGLINIKRCKDLNRTKPSNSIITSVKFHPSAKIAFTASLNKNLHFFQVDGKENERLQSIFLTNFPIYCADFHSNGDKVICTSRRKYFYIYDMIAGSVVKVPGIRGREEKSLEKFTLSPDGELIAFLGDSGYVNLVSSKTCHWIASLKMNNKVNAAAFSPDASRLFTAGRDGEVYIWDVKSRRCLHRFVDDGCLICTGINISPDGRYVATGSSSGVVNIYDDKCFVEKSPTPLKAMMNLTTNIGGVQFNSSSEILACHSAQVRNALKLLHFPSLTTFSNWPLEKQTLGNVTCLDFSPKSGFLSIGNEAGKALLFRLNHFPDS